MTTKRGFTLIEVLIAAGVLFIVSAAVVGLSNSLVQGTSATNDKTQVSLWAQSGLDLVGKIRDDNVAAGTGDVVWLSQAKDSVANYGWYTLTPLGAGCSNPTSWQLTPVGTGSTPETKLTIQDVLQNNKGELPCADGSQPGLVTLGAQRLICFEAYAANDSADGNNLDCNYDASHTSLVNDGSRIDVSGDCQTTAPVNDLYCKLTKSSLNQTGLTSTYIPSGNAMKVKSVIVWQDRLNYQNLALSTILTNWKTPSNL